MRQVILALLKKLALVTAWLVVLLAGALFLAEESGVLAHEVRRQLANRLGDLGEGLAIDHVRLRWFEPGVTLKGVSINVPRDGDPFGGEEILRIRAIHVSLAPDLDLTHVIQEVNIRGGRLRVSDNLFDGLDMLARSRPTGTAKGPLRKSLDPPRLQVSDLAVELEFPDGSVRELGRTDLIAGPDQGGLRLRGRIVPTLAGAVPEPEVIVIEGRVLEGESWTTGLSLRARARDVGLETESFSAPALLGDLPVSAFAGELSMDATVELHFEDRVEAKASLRASVRESKLVPIEGAPPLEDFELDLDGHFDLRADQGLWERESWTALARVRADWDGSPFAAWGRYGRELPAGTLFHGWARAERLGLLPETYRALGLTDEQLEPADALGLAGRAELNLDVRIADPGPQRPRVLQAPKISFRLRHTGESTMSYRGFREPDGSREGFPLRWNVESGDWVFVYDEEQERPWHVGIADKVGRSGSGTARVGGFVSGPRGEREEDQELDLEIEFADLEVGPDLRAALGEHPATRDVFDDYAPAGGFLSSRWRFHQSEAAGGLTAEGVVGVREIGLAWKELPVPMEKATGELTFRWAAQPIPMVGPQAGQLLRPFGMTYRFWNDPEASLLKARVFGSVREEIGPYPDRLTSGEDLILTTRIEVDEVRLRGRDWETLARTQPELGQTAMDLGAKGSMRVRFEGGRPGPGKPYASSVEATPNEVEVTPLFFPRRTRNLRGRVLVNTLEVDPAAESDDTEVNFTLIGEWPGDVELAARGNVPPRGNAVIDLYGAGIDPSNTAFQGALLQALSEDQDGVLEINTSDLRVGGRIDVHTRTEFDVLDEVAPPVASHRIFLRQNDLETESLTLRYMEGVLTQAEDLIKGDVIQARLHTHPVVLRDFRYMSLADVYRVPDADPLLLRDGFWNDPSGFALQADLEVDNLPVKREYLETFLEAETVDFICDELKASGKVDIQGARVVLVGEADNQSKIGFRGPIRPHDLDLQPGLACKIKEANVVLEEFVMERERLRGWCRIDGLYATILERELNDASMILSYIDGRLTIDDLSGSFEGGTLASYGGKDHGATALAVDVAEPYSFDVRLQMDNVRVGDLLQGVFASSLLDKGLVDVWLRLKGKPGSVLGITGSGHVSLDEGQLYSIPVMRELFGQLGLEQTAVFDRLRTNFEIRDGRIQAPDVKIKSSIFNLEGSGYLDFDGSLLFDLEVRYSLIDKLPIVSQIIYLLNNSLAAVSVRGDMDRPRVTIRNAVFEFLFGFDQRETRSLPLPPFAEPPERF